MKLRTAQEARKTSEQNRIAIVSERLQPAIEKIEEAIQEGKCETVVCEYSTNWLTDEMISYLREFGYEVHPGSTCFETVISW